jgi:hypothetical protein
MHNNLYLSKKYMPAPRYTEAELHELNLPGFMEPACLDVDNPYGSLFKDTQWQPVLNLAVVTEVVTPDDRLDLRVLTAIRRAEANPTHPDVVSTPTQRIVDRDDLKHMLVHASPYLDLRPPSLPGEPPLEHLPRPFHLREVNPSQPAVVAEFGPKPHDLITHNTMPLEALSRKLLVDKLGQAAICAPEFTARLAEKGIYPSLGKVSLSRLVAGFSYVSDRERTGEPEFEPIVMLGAVMHCTYPLLIPAETNDYRNISWTSLDAFASNVRERNSSNLIWGLSNADQIRVCVRGLCLSTSVVTTSADAKLGQHMNLALSPGPLPSGVADTIATNLRYRDTVGDRMLAQATSV